MLFLSGSDFIEQSHKDMTFIMEFEYGDFNTI